MHRTALDQVGGWDAHNVTEDADLSFRLAAYGHHIGYIHPPTQEEACLLYTSPSPRDATLTRMPSSA